MAERPSNEQAIESLRLSWLNDRPVSVEQLLEQHPEIDDPDSVVDLIYAEILLREENGHTNDEKEYLQRFPDYHDQIRRQFQLHRLLTEDEQPISTMTGGRTLAPDRPPQGESVRLALPGFEIQSVVGRGGSGVAYRAYDQKLKRVVAVKVLQNHLDVDDQLLREAEAAAALVHPAIVQIYQVGDVDGVPFLVMELIEGQSLAERLRDGPLPAREAAEMMVAVADAIQFAHQKSIIHRDLKPGNVLLDQEGQPHVCDFGLARKLDSEFTLHATGDVVGTPAYMAPEQARGESVSQAADVYSLGAILYHLLTGRPPFQAATPWEILNQVMVEDPLSLRQLNAAVPRDLETICSVALHKNPGRRFASAASFGEDLKRFLQGQPIQSRPVSFAERAWKLCQRNRALASLVAVSAIALIAIAVVAVVSERRVSRALIESGQALTSARTQRDVAFDAMKRLVNEVYLDLQKHEASVEARGEVLQSAIDGLQAIIDTGGNREEILTTMVRARTQLAFILAQQGKHSEADQQFDRAKSLGLKLVTLDGRAEYASTLCQFVAHCIRLARTAESQEAAEAARKTIEGLLSEAPESDQLRSIHALTLSHYGRVLTSTEEFDAAIEHFEEARGISAGLIEENKDNSKARRMLADINVELASVLMQVGRTMDASVVIKQCRKLIDSDEFDVSEDNQLFRSFLRSCRLAGVAHYKRQEFEQAHALLLEALRGWERLVKVEPKRPGFRLQVGVVSQDLMRWCLAQQDLEAAEIHIQRQLDSFAEGMKLGGPEYRVQGYAICQAHGAMSDLHYRWNDLESSRKSIQLAADALEPLVKEFDSQALFDALLYRKELISALMDQPSKATDEDAELVRSISNLWRFTALDDLTDFDALVPKLTAQALAHEDMFVRYGCLLNLAACHGQRYRVVHSTDTADEIAGQTLEALKVFIAAGISFDDILSMPDMREFRETKVFKDEYVNQG